MRERAERPCFLTQSKRELSQWAGEKHWNIARSVNGTKKKGGYIIMTSKKRNGGRRERIGKGVTLQWAFWDALNYGPSLSAGAAIARQWGG